MSLSVKPMRYAHPEGHTDVCYFSGEKGGLITCGADGDVRTWLSLLDDDPAASCISEQVTTVISKNGKLYVGTDNNTVQILSYPDLEKEGIVTRFSATVSALSTARNSNLIVSGSCDTRIQVTNINTSDSIELSGHEAPILGLTLDPKEEFVASSSADGSIRVWNIKEKRIVHVWNNVVPKSNSFFTAKTYSTPSFHSKDGRLLAYPHGKEIVIVERLSWKELFRLRCPTLKTEISICKFSECGTRLAASSVYGEIAVWNVESKDVIGYTEHQQNVKITAISWSLDEPNEIAFCDYSGQLGCIEVLNKSIDTFISDFVTNGTDNLVMERDVGDGDYFDDDDDDDGENVISLNKIKASINLEDDQKTTIDTETEILHDIVKATLPEVTLQQPFQPGSSPVHLLSRFMAWNDTGLVACYNSEDNEASSIEVEFHDSAVHHAIHINNYLGHTLAALSSQALVLACPRSDDTASKIVTVVLQGWGSGNKEWSVDLPIGEEAQCLAVGDTFIALSTTRRNLRLYMIGGTQREVIALPGQTVAMNAHGDYLVVAYHAGLAAPRDQCINLFWMRIRGPNLRNQVLNVPLSPTSELIWLGLSELGSPTIMDTDGVIKLYDKKSSLWRVACDTDRQCKGKSDHFFIIGVSEAERTVRCVLCKGSHYPPTTPRPAVREIPLIIPLCEPDTEKSEKEAKLWQLGSHPLEEKEALLTLIAHACRSDVEYRAVELCEQLASQKVIELAIKYAGRISRMALANKLESIATIKDQREREEEIEGNEDNCEGRNDNDIETVGETALTPVMKKKPELEIKPLTLSVKRNNPFLKRDNSPMTKGLCGLNTLPDKPQKVATSVVRPPMSKEKKTPKRETFVSWFAKNKKELQQEFPDLDPTELTRTALRRYKEMDPALQNSSDKVTETKKRKLSERETDQDSQSKRSISDKLSDFTVDK